MTELIRVFDHEGLRAVSARELHTFLQSKQQFADWIKNRIEKYGLIEAQDFVTFSENYEKGRPMIEYVLTLDSAKELSMVEANERGQQARRYFIECEKQLKTQQVVGFNPATISRREMALMILEAEDKIQALSQEITQLEKVVISQSKKVAFVDEVLTAKNCWTTTTIAKDLGMSAMGLNKLLKDIGIQFKRDEHWVLKSPYQNKGYTKTETHPYQVSDGSTRTSLSTVWTELGRAFIVKQVNDYRQRISIAQVPTLNQPGANA